MTPAGLELQNVVKRFGAHAAVDGASLAAKNGEIIALLGPSGCGKTTSLRLIAGFEKLDGGRILVGGNNIAGLPPFRRDIGLVFQDYALFPHMTVRQNVDYGMRQRDISRADRDNRRRELLRLVRLEGLEDRRPGALSGGQQQRVALARALAISPKLLLLDEPLSNLDAKLREALRVELREILRTVGMTTLVVTHDQTEAIGIADRIALMNLGRIVQVGTPREIYEEPATRFVAEFIGQSLWFTGRFDPKGSTEGRFATDDGLTFMAARPVVAASRYGLSIRPEHVHLGARASDINRFGAVVERVDFFGAELILRCRLDAGGRMVAIPIRSDDTAIPNAGDRIELGVAMARCRVVADE
jgi:ABC-type Fe3+/spermidine/putrescine transport system ATPase subunit